MTCPHDEDREIVRNELSQITFKTTLILCQFQHCPSTMHMASHVHGGSTGCTRIAYLNMTEPGQCCPSPWTQFTSGNKRVCLQSIVSSGGSCDSVFYSSPQQQGYTVRCVAASLDTSMEIHMDSIAAGFITLITTILMGKVLPMHGQSPRQYIWTFAAGWSEIDNNITDRSLYYRLLSVWQSY